METDADKLAEEAFRAMAEVGKLRAENARLMVAKMPTSEDYNRIIGEREALRALNSELLSVLRFIDENGHFNAIKPAGRQPTRHCYCFPEAHIEVIRALIAKADAR